MSHPILPGTLLAAARRAAGLTQAELSRRLGLSQAAVAQLERPDSNPRLATLDRALRATGSELVLTLRPREPSIDEGLIRRHLELTPRERLEALESTQAQARMLGRAGRVSRGEQPV
ncbi:MAG TPA: helix-turn-helix domain-containing protein [Solirubrobacteraceae bacterium]|nr:helix-turn-helix domain-containing protein [Solirubrobacteraceae bacterium]